MTNANTRLIGEELRTKVKEMNLKFSKGEMVRACGYVSRQEDGTEKLLFINFYQALFASYGCEMSEAEVIEQLIK